MDLSLDEFSVGVQQQLADAALAELFGFMLLHGDFTEVGEAVRERGGGIAVRWGGCTEVDVAARGGEGGITL